MGLRFVKDGEIFESLLDVPCVSHDKLDALSLTQSILAVLDEAGWDRIKLSNRYLANMTVSVQL